MREPDATGVVRATLELGVVWWMYDGYAWLTNAVSPRAPAYRLLLLSGMGAFLVVALAIPEAFGDNGLAFGVAYVVINVIHLGMFMQSSERMTVVATLRLARFNVVSALLVLAAGFVEGNLDWILWGGAFAVQWVTPYLTGIGGFSIRPEHFVERHGLVVIIALGESIVAVGIGAAHHAIDATLLKAALLGLALAAALWWLYFDGEDERAERALTAAERERRPWLAVHAFGYAFLPLLGGIVMLAAGIKKAIEHVADPLTSAGAWFLAGGVALYLAALVWLRLVLRTGSPALRAAAAAAALVTVPVGTEFSAELQMAALVVVLLALAASERSLLSRAPARRPR